MTRLSALSPIVLLLACSHGGADDIDEEARPDKPASAPVDSRYFRTEALPALPCRPAQVLGCDTRGDRNDRTIVVCDDGTSAILTKGEPEWIEGRVLACADVDADQLNDLVVLSSNRLQAGRFSVPVLAADVRAARTDTDHDGNFEIVLWGFASHPTVWSPKAGVLKELAWATGDCVGDGSLVACASDDDPKTWRLVGEDFAAGDVVASRVDFRPLALLDVDLDGVADLAGSRGSGLAWASATKQGAWSVQGSCLLGLRESVLVVPTSEGGWGIVSQAIDPLPAWDSPLDGEPLGAVLYEQDNPRALIADPATRRAWKVSILPRRVP